MSVLSGGLENFALPDVFRLLAHNKVTGALRVARASGEGTVFFRDGEVYFAFSNLTREFLGQRLVNAKLITEGQLLRMLDEQKKAGEKRIGDLLVEKGFISKELLHTFLKEQIQDAIFSMLQWDVGAFEFLSNELAPQEIGLTVSVENLIMESSRRIQEWEVIRRKIPSLEVVVRMAPTPPEDAVEINIRPEEWTLLVLADGTRTVREIAGASERSEFDACKIIYGLVTAGLLDVASSATAVGAVEAPAAARAVLPKESREEVRREVPIREVVPEKAEVEPEPAVPEVIREPARPAEAEALVSDEGAEPVTIAEERVEEERAEPAVAPAMPDQPRNGSAREAVPVGAKKKGDPTMSKELLLRLIAGVRNL